MQNSTWLQALCLIAISLDFGCKIKELLTSSNAMWISNLLRGGLTRAWQGKPQDSSWTYLSFQSVQFSGPQLGLPLRFRLWDHQHHPLEHSAPPHGDTGAVVYANEAQGNGDTSLSTHFSTLALTQWPRVCRHQTNTWITHKWNILIRTVEQQKLWGLHATN